MKKQFYLLVLALMPLCFTACGGSDDDEETGVSGIDALYGTWQMTNGAAFEDGAFHHERSIDADEAEYVRFDKSGTCYVREGNHGMLRHNGNYNFTFNQESKVLTIGSDSFVVDVLGANTLKLKYYWSSSRPDDYNYATYKKVSDSVWDTMK